ncbi:MAG: DNA cytosine methyltransferase, partial [Bifidobacterium crudilactis]|nr:DNA cytosine methyltransferase [Bifidobacterium crudilactis]
MSMRYISLFSGIEAASCAWEHLGWEPIAFSEIEPLPKAVLKHHYPNVPDLGDITKIDWSSYVGSADVVVGGSPCQSFSVAGSRTGLAGASGLMWEYVRAVQAIRPQWFVW